MITICKQKLYNVRTMNSTFSAGLLPAFPSYNIKYRVSCVTTRVVTLRRTKIIKRKTLLTEKEKPQKHRWCLANGQKKKRRTIMSYCTHTHIQALYTHTFVCVCVCTVNISTPAQSFVEPLPEVTPPPHIHKTVIVIPNRSPSSVTPKQNKTNKNRT